MRVLRSFVNNYRDGVPALAQGYRPELLATWMQVCHSACGACAAIGAHTLADELHLLERMLVQPEVGAAELGRLAGRLQVRLLALVGLLKVALRLA
jgi:acylphosphatase